MLDAETFLASGGDIFIVLLEGIDTTLYAFVWKASFGSLKLIKSPLLNVPAVFPVIPITVVPATYPEA